MVTRPCITFPPAPLKFRTAGFPQYGFKPALGSHLRRRANARRLIDGQSPARPRTLVSPQGEITARTRRGIASPQNCPVQRPLARQRVILSRRVDAYYGLIRGSRPLPTTYYSSSSGLCLAAKAWRFPALICLSFCPCRLPYPGGSGGDRCFKSRPWQPSPIREGLGIRGNPRKSRLTRGLCNEAAQFALCCGPDSC